MPRERMPSESITVWSDFLRQIATTAIAVVLIAALCRLGMQLPAGYPLFVAVAVAFGTAALTLCRLTLERDHPHDRLGNANRLTLARGGLVALLGGLIPLAPAINLGWLAVAIATLGATLDAVDGAWARREGTASAFGARLDMETDALLIMILAVLAWSWGKAGVWVLLSGALRYLFLAAAAHWSWLGSPLPPSRRRQTVCVVQVIGLIVLLLPFLSSPLTDVVAAAALLALGASFAIDVRWLAHRRAHKR